MSSQLPVIYGRFTAYTPSFNGIPTDSTLRMFRYYQNEAGQDWYAVSRPLPTGSSTYAIINDDGSIRVASNDQTTLSPLNGRFVAIPILADPTTLKGKLIDLATGEITDAPLPPPRPAVVSKAQGRLALLEAGILDRAEAAIAAGDRAGQIWYESSTEWRRDHPMISVMASALNITESQIDSLFTLAATK